MEWYFTFEEGMYETQMHLPIYVDSFFKYDVFQMNRPTHVLIIAINIQVWEHRDTFM